MTSPPPIPRSGSSSSRIPHRLIVIAGTYDGVLAGWDTDHSSTITSSDDVEKVKEESIEVRLLRKMNDGKYLKLLFAMSAHEGSVRCIDIATTASVTPSFSSSKSGVFSESSSFSLRPGTLLSGGYDESINVYNILKKNQIGELRTPPDLGSPTCCSFAPPSNNNMFEHGDGEDGVGGANQTSTHAVVGTTSGKLIIYKRRDWSVQHILSGHGGSVTNTNTTTSSTTSAASGGGVSCLAVHPTGRMALSGGRSDGKIILWDLVKGRLAYVHKIPASTSRNGSNGNGRRAVESINHIVWSTNGSRYAYCYGSHITARDATSGETLLDVNMYPCPRVNQLTFVGGKDGLFIAAACDDGSLPVLEVGHLLLDDDDDNDDDDDADNTKKTKKEDTTRRAIMAIEPVSGPVAGDDRFKCICSVVGGSGFLVVTANSGGVISLMDLEGAARMMLTPNEENEEEDDDSGIDKDDDDSDIDSEDDGDSDDEVEAAVEILDSVRVGSGARITDLAVWSYGNGDGGCEKEDDDDDNVGDSIDEGDEDDENESLDSDEVSSVVNGDEDEKEILIPSPTSKQLKYPITKAKGQRFNNNREEQKIELNAEAIEKARKLVGQAKEHQKKTKKRKLSNKNST